MTEQERTSREQLLKRAAAAAGALYAAPMLTPAAAAQVERGCGRRKCVPGGDGDVKCARKGCMCCSPHTGRCAKQRRHCCLEDPRCPEALCPAEPAVVCNNEPPCMCFGVIPGRGCAPVDCIDFASNFCADYPPCDKADGSGCPPGMCCLDSNCPDGICGTPCGTASGRRARSAGTGPTLVRDLR
jgi:hypothetical protein